MRVAYGSANKNAMKWLLGITEILHLQWCLERFDLNTFISWLGDTNCRACT